MTGPLTTFSLVGRCDRTGQLGVVVSTADVGAGRMVTWAKAGVGAVATQSWPSLYLAIDALGLMEAAPAPRRRWHRSWRTIPDGPSGSWAWSTAAGESATFSGDECEPWFGGINGANFAAQGNMLIRGETVSALADSFAATEELDLAERLVRAIEAGQAAGGDKRGRQCAALLVVDREEYPLWDIRVDESRDPVPELRRIFEIAKTDLLPFVQGLPTRENPMGSLSDEFVAMNMLPPPERAGHGGSGPMP